MLALTLKVGESAVLGNGVLLYVAKIRQNNVRLGIKAPDEVRIVRGRFLPEELLDGIRNGTVGLPELTAALEAIVKPGNEPSEQP